MRKYESAIYCFCFGKCESVNDNDCGRLYLSNTDGIRMHVKIPSGAKRFKLQISAINIIIRNNYDSNETLDAGIVLYANKGDKLKEYKFSSFTRFSTIATIWLNTSECDVLLARINDEFMDCDKSGYLQFKIVAYEMD